MKGVLTRKTCFPRPNSEHRGFPAKFLRGQSFLRGVLHDHPRRFPKENFAIHVVRLIFFFSKTILFRERDVKAVVVTNVHTNKRNSYPPEAFARTNLRISSVFNEPLGAFTGFYSSKAHTILAYCRVGHNTVLYSTVVPLFRIIFPDEKVTKIIDNILATVSI